jgi:aspartate/methionine/tyrosine aminotransferase
MREAEKLAQNLYVAPPSLAQHAALAAFEPASLAIFEERRLAFQRRRDFLVPALRSMGFEVPVVPDGAFYVYADCSAFSQDSSALASRLLEEAGVAVTPGKDFGSYRAATHLRVAYTRSMDQLEEGIARLARVLQAEELRGALRSTR